MAGIRESLDGIGRAQLERFTQRASADRFTGTLRVAGRPGGMLFLCEGLVVSAASPGAPGPQALLERTARSGAVGEAHLEAMRMLATQDALFAIVAGSIDACLFEDEGRDPGGMGDHAGELLALILRRLEALAALPRPILPHRERLAPTRPRTEEETPSRRPGMGPQDDAALLRDVILRFANGDRTARDIAFAAGRGVYAVTVEMSRMLAEGLLYEPPPPRSDIAPRDVPRPEPGTSRAPVPPAVQALTDADQAPRRPEARDTPARRPSSSRRAFGWFGRGDDERA